jgi:putative tricarboxylic transport membrane protein
MEILESMLTMLTNPMLLVYVAAGVFFGIYIGAIPGLSVSMAASLLISFTFTWDVLPALAVMIGINVGGVYGGSRSAILLNIPGAPAAVATGLDGYPLAQKGKAGEAIGITVVQSVIGGFVGALVLAFGAPVIAKFALAVSPRDYFLLAMMGMLLVGSLGNESMARGIFSAGIGVFIGCIGLDMVTGQPRFAFGNVYLMGGVNYIVVMIGLFGVSEALVQMRDMSVYPVKQQVGKLFPGFEKIIKYIPLSIRCSLIGTVVGALPGTGGDIAALICYDHAKRSTKNPEVPFGEGAIEGLVAPESANNAAIGGAYIPMLTLGIPGDAVTAIMLGSLFIHGLRPGPMLMTQSADAFYFIIAALFVANTFLLIFGFTGIKLFTKVVEVPKHILMPSIIILSVIGAYAYQSSVMDVYWMLGCGVLGYLMKMFKLPVAPTILGVILSSLIEQNFRRGVTMSGNNVFVFVLNMFRNPISLALSLFIIFMLLSSAGVFARLKRKK